MTKVVVEAGFKLVPGMHEEFTVVHDRILPLASSQPGFISVYAGPILDSTWLYFGARFSDAKLMDDWHHHPRHQAVQRQAYARWWSAVYLRKWVTPEPDASPAQTFMCETRLVTSAQLGEREMVEVRSVLSQLGAAGAQRFETLTGEYEPQPYQFAGPLEIAPHAEGSAYSLITHWASGDAVEAWLKSVPHQRLARLGALVSECFRALPESGERNHLRSDRKQREWTSSSPTQGSDGG